MTGTVAKLQPQIGRMVNEQVKKNYPPSDDVPEVENWGANDWLITPRLMPSMAKAC